MRKAAVAAAASFAAAGELIDLDSQIAEEVEEVEEGDMYVPDGSQPESQEAGASQGGGVRGVRGGRGGRGGGGAGPPGGAGSQKRPCPSPRRTTTAAVVVAAAVSSLAPDGVRRGLSASTPSWAST